MTDTGHDTSIYLLLVMCFVSICQWAFQELKLDFPTIIYIYIYICIYIYIYVYIYGLCFRAMKGDISPNYGLRISNFKACCSCTMRRLWEMRSLQVRQHDHQRVQQMRFQLQSLLRFSNGSLTKKWMGSLTEGLSVMLAAGKIGKWMKIVETPPLSSPGAEYYIEKNGYELD